jgi:hypothetical protein
MSTKKNIINEDDIKTAKVKKEPKTTKVPKKKEKSLKEKKIDKNKAEMADISQRPEKKKPEPAPKKTAVEISIKKESPETSLQSEKPAPLKIGIEEMIPASINPSTPEQILQTVSKKPEKKIEIQIGEGSFMQKLKRAGLEENLAQTEKKDDQVLATQSDSGSLIEKIHHLSPSKLKMYRKIAFIFIGLTVVLLTAVFYFMLVKTTIVLIPNQERTSNNLIIDVYDASSGQAASGNSIIGKIDETDVKSEKVIMATGDAPISQMENGQVTIINNYIKNQPLVASTRLLAPDGKLFRLKNTVNVPSGGSVMAEIYPDDPKNSLGTVAMKLTIPGLWAGIQDKIYAEIKGATTSEQITKKIILQSDIDSGIKELKETLKDKVKNEIGQKYSSFNQVIYNIDENSILTEVNGRAGDEKDRFTIKLNAKAEITAYNEDVIIKLAKDKLISVLPKNKELLEISKKNITYAVSDFSYDQKRSSLNVTFEGVMVLSKNADIIDRKALTGLSKSAVEQHLNKLTDIAGYEIKFSPSFIKRTPYLVDRIKVEIKK